jgi:hypothetical protein
MNHQQNQKKDRTMRIVGINVIVLIGYTLWARISAGNDGALMLAFLIAIHFFICLLIAPFVYSRGFVLSALAVLLIGFSTCYLAYTIH